MPEHWARCGFGWYAWIEVETVALIARGSPKRAHIAGHDGVEIDWTVMPERWNQGYATGLGAASVVIAFGPLGLADVVSFTVPHNWASRR
jgi:ribosomal-protein-alanine N-acetyltransferase